MAHLSGPYRVPIVQALRISKDGEEMFAIPRNLFQQHDERALIAQLMCDRRLFGQLYLNLLPDYFWQMPDPSGVLLARNVPTDVLLPGETRPGDIDLLVIPYEGTDLILDKTMALEVKVVRASFADQGRSPNQFGFSQSEHLLRLGFPYAGVLHLIKSDQSPRLEWRRLLKATMGEGDQVRAIEEVMVDTLPSKLIDRCFGRMLAARRNQLIGLGCAYLGDPADPGRGVWMPNGVPALLNPSASAELLSMIHELFCRYQDRFVATPRHD